MTPHDYLSRVVLSGSSMAYIKVSKGPIRVDSVEKLGA
jgi:hypothetical protein